MRQVKILNDILWSTDFSIFSFWNFEISETSLARAKEIWCRRHVLPNVSGKIVLKLGRSRVVKLLCNFPKLLQLGSSRNPFNSNANHAVILFIRWYIIYRMMRPNIGYHLWWYKLQTSFDIWRLPPTIIVPFIIHSSHRHRIEIFPHTMAVSQFRIIHGN